MQIITDNETRISLTTTRRKTVHLCQKKTTNCQTCTESPDESFMSRPYDEGGGSRAPPTSFSLIMASPVQRRESLMNLSSHFRWTKLCQILEIPLPSQWCQRAEGGGGKGERARIRES